MQKWADLEEQFTHALALRRAPVAVTFTSDVPPGVKRHAGEVPSGCSFWKIAAESKGPIATVPSDHHNCPIGSYTHNIALPPERSHELNDVLGVFQDLGYVEMEEVPRILRLSTSPKAVIYARLGVATLAPDVVVFALSASSAMLLNEAARSAGAASGLSPLPRPTCMALPAAMAAGATMSFGCVGNRVYTELESGEVYLVVRGADLAKIAAALTTILHANRELEQYHHERKQRLTVLR
jgi:uncharacterized protein (DUF169 family)